MDAPGTPQLLASAARGPDVEVTILGGGESQPADAPADPWSAVVCPKTGGTYYWNTLTNETTMVGEPKPQTMYRQPVQPEAHGSMGGMIVSNVVLGAGVALGFGLVSAVLC